jgi:hypothetical protein
MILGDEPLISEVVLSQGGDSMGFGLIREGGGTVQWLGFSWCTGGARRTTAMAGRTSGGGASDRRRKKGTGWTMGRSGRVGRMPLGLAQRENKEKKVGWAARMTGPKSRVGCRKFLFKF